MLGKLTAGLAVSIAVAMVLLGDGNPAPPEKITETVLDPVAPAANPAPKLAAVSAPVRPAPPLRNVIPTATPLIEPVAAEPPQATPDPVIEDAPAPVEIAEIPPIRPVPRPETPDLTPLPDPEPDPATDIAIVTASGSDTILLPTIERVAVDSPRLAPASILYAIDDGVNLYDGPSVYDRIVIQLAIGDTAKLIADPGTGWLLVKTVDSGRQGFIPADLMAPVD